MYQIAGLGSKSIDGIIKAKQAEVSYTAISTVNQMNIATMTDNLAHSVIDGALNGVLSLITGAGYASYDFLDRSDMAWKDEKQRRLITMLMEGRFNIDNIKKAINIIMFSYYESLNDEEKRKLEIKVLGKLIGGKLVSKLVAEKLALNVIIKTENIFLKLLYKNAMVKLASIPVINAKCIYKSRELNTKNPRLYYLLLKNGDLDLLYFLLEPYIGVYVNMLYYSEHNVELFNEINKVFLG